MKKTKFCVHKHLEVTIFFNSGWDGNAPTPCPPPTSDVPGNNEMVLAEPSIKVKLIWEF